MARKRKEEVAEPEEQAGGGSFLRRMVDVRLAYLGERKADFCRRVGITPGRLAVWSRTGVDQMTVRGLRKLAAGLGVAPAVLLSEGPDLPSQLTAV